METFNQQRYVRFWLYTCATMILIMVGIGGVTRLTQSGLSITEWLPIKGMLPPLSEQDWRYYFEAYQTSPEFLQKNHDMNLTEFKHIFWWEFIHRFWGRLIGLVFFVPLIVFWLKHYITNQQKKQFLGIAALGLLQGIIGWWMVTSGLQDKPEVSHFRLSTHLILALLLYSGFVYALIPWREPKPSIPYRYYVLLIWSVVTIIFGAFVAGLDAGLIFNTFPLMNGALIPYEIGFYQPFMYDMLHNPTTIQFLHRYLAISLWCFALISFIITFNKKNTIIFLIFSLQAMLGIITLIYAVPLVPAVMHQLNAFIIITTLIWAIKS